MVADKNYIQNIVETALIDTTKLEKGLEYEDGKSHIKIVKSGWYSPSEIHMCRLDLRENDAVFSWFIGYALTPAGIAHLNNKKKFCKAAPEMVKYDLMPAYFYNNFPVNYLATKYAGQSVQDIACEGELSEVETATIVSRLFGASQKSIEDVLGRSVDKLSHHKTLLDTSWENVDKNEDQFCNSLVGMIKEAQNSYLKPALKISENLNSKYESGPIKNHIARGFRLLAKVKGAGIDPYTPTVVLPADMAPTNITIDNEHKGRFIDQPFRPERITVRGSPLSIIKTYERIINEETFRVTEIFEKVIRILKKEYLDVQKKTWARYAPLVTEITDFYHDARHLRTYAQISAVQR